MKGRVDIHDYEGRLRLAEKAIHNPLPKRSRELLEEYEKQLLSEGLSAVRVAKYLYILRRIADMLDKPFEEATVEDIKDLVYRIERGDYSPWTKHDYKVALKRFYKWLKGNNEEYPPEVKWIKTTLKARDELLPEDLLTEEDVMRLVNAVDSPRDKAFIITLYESGARIGELGSMRMRDVKFEEGYTALTLSGKTGSRRVIVVASTPYLMNWMQNHPLRSKPDAPLWVNMGTVNRYEAMTYPALAKILKVAAEKAGLGKKIHPHKLRHSRATFLASKLTEAQMNQVFGWRQGSKMPSIYVHLSGRDLDEAILGVYGLKKREETEPKLKPKICPRCSTPNQFDARFCIKCGLALDVKAAMEVEEARRTTDSIMDLLMKDPGFRELLVKKLAELKKA
ncbi:tyrosine-type recombinase/integrase [Candidatus Bathyarchaeota archaeon]|nr:tyrosine-type recombinase/integrase [Candidatus Bathyarchaeota archaeon]